MFKVGPWKILTIHRHHKICERIIGRWGDGQGLARSGDFKDHALAFYGLQAVRYVAMVERHGNLLAFYCAFDFLPTLAHGAVFGGYFHRLFLWIERNYYLVE